MQNIEKFFELCPLDEVAFVTVTPPGPCTAAELQRRWHSFMTGVFGDQVGHYVRVIEWQKNGNPHFHLLVHIKGKDIRTGFNWGYHQARAEIQKSGLSKEEREVAKRRAKKHYGGLTANENLIALWKLIDRGRAKYGLGLTEVVPIRKNGEAVARYLAKYLTKEGNQAPIDPKTGKRERVRQVEYSRVDKKPFPRACSSQFSWYGAKAQIYREKVKRFAVLNGCSGPEEVAEKFGPHWRYNCRAAIAAMPGEYEARGACSLVNDKGERVEAWGTAYEEVRVDRAPETLPQHTDVRAAKVRRWAKELGLEKGKRRFPEEAVKRYGGDWMERYREDIEQTEVAGDRPDYRRCKTSQK